MGVSREKIAAMVTKAFTKLGNIRTTVTFNRIVPGEYDPATGAVSDTTVSTTVRNALLTNVSSSEAGWFPADRNTQKLLIAPSALPVRPTTTDTVTIAGVTWEIVKVRPVTGDSLWTVFIMEP